MTPGRQPGAGAVAGAGVGSLLGGRYVLEAMVATGGMGALFRGRDTVLDRTVAVKTLHPHLAGSANAERFLQEGQTLASLTHPNLVMVYDMGMADGLPYLVMEFIEGESLAAFIERTAPVPLAAGIVLALQLCRGLAYAHTWGVIHRDIKPHNVLITPEGQAKIIDFGIARGPVAAEITEPGWVLGTAHYLAPETAAGQPATVRSDLYALGVVLYRLFTGRLPFDGSDPLAVAMLHRTAAPPPPSSVRPGLPKALDDVVLRLLEKDPARRYAAAGEVAAALTRVARAGLAGSAPSAAQEPTTVLPATVPLPHPDATTAAVARPTAKRAARAPAGPRVWHWLLLVTAAAVAAWSLWGWLRLAVAAPAAPRPAVTAPAAPTLPPTGPVLARPAPAPTASPGRAGDLLTALVEDIKKLTAGDRGGEREQLLKRAEDMAQQLAQGKPAGVGAKANEVRDQIGDLVRRGELTASAAARLYDRLRALVHEEAWREDDRRD